MTDSSINLSVGQMLASGVFNADGVTPLYSAGALAFKNSAGVTTFSVSDAGASITGPTTANVTHIDYGAVKRIYQAYTGGLTRTLSTAPANFIVKKSYFDSFENLTTTPWSLIGGNYFQMGSILFTIITAGGSVLTFFVTTGFVTGDSWYIGASAPTGNCTVSVTGLVLTVTQGTLVYTIAFGAYHAATIKANALETGTTIVITDLTQTRTQI